MSRILVIAATKKDRLHFERFTYLGLSLKKLAFDRNIQSSIVYENREGLPVIYNSHLTAAHRDSIAVFTHDDVYIDDFMLSWRLVDAMQKFDVIGLAGNKNRTSHQPSWAFVMDGGQMKWDKPENLSGAVSHFAETGSSISPYGVMPAECQLLDGVFMAARVGDLIDRKVRFDERFPFHFYDLDFCRTATGAGLRLGTWPIAVTHASGGSFGSPEWNRCRDLYFQKWKE